MEGGNPQRGRLQEFRQRRGQLGLWAVMEMVGAGGSWMYFEGAASRVGSWLDCGGKETRKGGVEDACRVSGHHAALCAPRVPPHSDVSSSRLERHPTTLVTLRRARPITVSPEVSPSSLSAPSLCCRGLWGRDRGHPVPPAPSASKDVLILPHLVSTSKKRGI